MQSGGRFPPEARRAPCAAQRGLLTAPPCPDSLCSPRARAVLSGERWSPRSRGAVGPADRQPRFPADPCRSPRGGGGAEHLGRGPVPQPHCQPARRPLLGCGRAARRGLQTGLRLPAAHTTVRLSCAGFDSDSSSGELSEASQRAPGPADEDTGKSNGIGQAEEGPPQENGVQKHRYVVSRACSRTFQRVWWPQHAAP